MIFLPMVVCTAIVKSAKFRQKQNLSPVFFASFTAVNCTTYKWFEIGSWL